MEKFIIGVKEIYEQLWEVNADTKEDAVTKLHKFLEDDKLYKVDDLIMLDEPPFWCDCLAPPEWSVYDSNRVE
jgi:hypothetical protein